jgi:hypothetical protein
VCVSRGFSGLWLLRYHLDSGTWQLGKYDKSLVCLFFLGWLGWALGEQEHWAQQEQESTDLKYGFPGQVVLSCGLWLLDLLFWVCFWAVDLECTYCRNVEVLGIAPTTRYRPYFSSCGTGVGVGTGWCWSAEVA